MVGKELKDLSQDSQDPCKNLGVTVRIWNPRGGEAETGRTLGSLMKKPHPHPGSSVCLLHIAEQEVGLLNTGEQRGRFS